MLRWRTSSFLLLTDMSEFSEPILTPQDIAALQNWRARDTDELRNRFRAVLSIHGRVSLDDIEPMLDELLAALS